MTKQSIKLWILAAGLAMISGYSVARNVPTIYPSINFAINTQSTLNCGNSNLPTCISEINLEQVTNQWCRDKVSDDTDPYLSLDGYYVGVNSYTTRVLSAVDNNNGVGGYAFTAVVQYSCRGDFHPGRMATLGH